MITPSRGVVNFPKHYLSVRSHRFRYTHSTYSQMSANAANGAAAPPSSGEPAGNSSKKAAPNGKKELKILMLHGYTQSGPLFDSKTKALGKLLSKALSPAPLSLAPRLVFPTGPHRLRARDIPGFELSSSSTAGEEDEDEGDNWAWFRKDEATGSYAGLEAGMRAVAAAIREAGGGEGVDGVVGFSQGGCVAALVAAALERREEPGPEPEPSDRNAGADAPDWSWVAELREANGGRPLKFCVVYSGFWAPVPELQWLYGGGDGDGEEGKIQTPTLHFLGSLDSVVEESRSRALIGRCRDPAVVVHPGGHYVPVARDRVTPLVGFLRKVLANQQEEEKL